MNFQKKIEITLLSLFLGIYSSSAQIKFVQGNVTVFDIYPVANARVECRTNRKTVFTDHLGLFSIEWQKDEKIFISAAGFKNKWVKIKTWNDSIHINLIFKGTDIDLELATAHGHIKKENLLNSIEKLESKKNGHFKDVLDMIRGRVPGVIIAGDKIHIRGDNTYSQTNTALIVVNGLVTEIGELKSIQVNDVKSINVLKGSAAAIYGIRGANGVIEVMLKGNFK